MTTEPFSPLRKALRLALMATSATLAVGLAMSLIVSGPAAPAAEALVWLGLAMLVAVPVFNVLDVLIIEWRLKEWPFAGAALAVLLLLAYSVLSVTMRSAP
jgi:hypothetical protein